MEEQEGKEVITVREVEEEQEQPLVTFQVLEEVDQPDYVL
jgi:hypothetical protein